MKVDSRVAQRKSNRLIYDKYSMEYCMNNKIKYCCINCNEEFTTNNLTKHYNRCLVKGGKISWNKIPDPNSLVCEFCDKLCKSKNSHTQHVRTCPKNENRNYKSYTLGLTAWNKGLSKETSPSLMAASIAMKQRGHGGWSKKASSNGGKRGGGYRENAGRSKKYRVIDSFGKQTTLQSSYEYKCFELLSEMNIRWIRPKALKYSGRNYFADFYLVDYDIYLDPKNNYKAKIDQEKISQVIKENQVKIFVLLQNEINNQYLGSILDMQTADNR